MGKAKNHGQEPKGLQESLQGEWSPDRLRDLQGDFLEKLEVIERAVGTPGAAQFVQELKDLRKEIKAEMKNAGPRVAEFQPIMVDLDARAEDVERLVVAAGNGAEAVPIDREARKKVSRELKGIRSLGERMKAEFSPARAEQMKSRLEAQELALLAASEALDALRPQLSSGAVNSLNADYAAADAVLSEVRTLIERAPELLQQAPAEVQKKAPEEEKGEKLISEKEFRRTYIVPLEQLQEELRRIELAAGKGRVQGIADRMTAAREGVERAKGEWSAAQTHYPWAAGRAEKEITKKLETLDGLLKRVDAVIARETAGIPARLVERYEALEPRVLALETRFAEVPQAHKAELDALFDEYNAISLGWNNLIDDQVKVEPSLIERGQRASAAAVQALQRMDDLLKTSEQAEKNTEHAEAHERLKSEAVELSGELEGLNKDLQAVIDREELSLGDHEDHLNDFLGKKEAIFQRWVEVRNMKDLPEEWQKVKGLGQELAQRFDHLEDIYFRRLHLRGQREGLKALHVGLKELRERTSAEVVDDALLADLERALAHHEQNFAALMRGVRRDDHEEILKKVAVITQMIEEVRPLVALAAERVPKSEFETDPAFAEIVNDDRLWKVDDLRARARVVKALVRHGGKPKNGRIVNDRAELFARVQQLKGAQAEVPETTPTKPERLVTPEDMRAFEVRTREWQQQRWTRLLDNYYWNDDVSAADRVALRAKFVPGQSVPQELTSALKHADHFKEDAQQVIYASVLAESVLDEDRVFDVLGGYKNAEEFRKAYDVAVSMMDAPEREIPKYLPAEEVQQTVVTPVEERRESKEDEKRRIALLSDGVFWLPYTKRQPMIKKVLAGDINALKTESLRIPEDFQRALAMKDLDQLEAFVEELKATRDAVDAKKVSVLADLEAAEANTPEDEVRWDDDRWFEQYFKQGVGDALARRVVPVRREQKAERQAERESTPRVIDVPERRIEAEKKVSSLASRFMSGVRRLFGRGAADSLELAKAQITGEKTTREREGGEQTAAEQTLRITGALLGSVASVVGVKSIPDVLRYLSQRKFVGEAKGSLQQEILAAFDQSREVANAADMQDDAREARNREAADRLQKSIEASKYLTNEQKRDLLARLDAKRADYATRSEWNAQERDREIADILEREMTTRVSGSVVVREVANTALVAGGAFALRGVVYGIHSLIERVQKIDQNDLSLVQKLQRAFVDGYGEWKEKMTSQRALPTAEAIGTLARVVGIAGLAVDDVIDALPSLEQLNARGVVTDAEEVISRAKLIVQEKIDELLGAPEAPNVWAQTEAYQTDPALQTETTGILPSIDAPAFGPAVTLPEDYRFLDAETLRLATVRNGDGITQVLARQIEASPETYGFAGDAEDVRLFAVKKALEIAKADHLDGSWLRGDVATGHVAIVPEVRGGVVHAIFRDIQTGNEIPLEELRERGITMKGR